MRPPLSACDFRLLDDPEFREDSVREEIVVPLLAALGYSSSPPHRIIRSRRLEHPYVYIGTVKKPIAIVPDYLLQRDGENAWILDAKAPQEVIDSGPHVEQAYSYAIHRDVRVPIYALCNGRRLVVFHVSEWPAVLDVPLTEIAEHWPRLLAALGTAAAWPGGLPPGVRADYGLALQKAGLTHDEQGKKIYQVFVSFQPSMITRVEDHLYSMSGIYPPTAALHAPDAEVDAAQGWWSTLMVSFDFGPDVYEKLLAALPEAARERTVRALTRQPYRVIFAKGETPTLTVVADPGDTIHKSAEGSYCPLLADEFIPEPQDRAHEF